MSKNLRLLLPASVMIFAILACSINVGGTTVPSVDEVGTAAAQTVAAQLGSASAPATAVAVAASPTTPPPAPAASTDTPVPSATPVCDQAKFVSETIPDGTIFMPGATFTKSWRLRNTGACTWNSSYALVFDNGNIMGAPNSVPLAGNVAPGQEVDVAASMVAPGTPGSYTGYWKLRNASGVLFGVEPTGGSFWVKIVVVAPTPTATATSSGPSVHIPLVPIVPVVPIIPLLLTSTSQVSVMGVNVPAGNVGTGTANCPSGSVVVSGGFAVGQDTFVYTQLQNGNGWQVYAKNTGGSDSAMTVFAICLSHTSGTTSFKLASGNAPVGSYGHVEAACPSGSVVTGGGFATNADGSLWVYNSTADGNSWQVYARNLSGSPQGFNVYAICLAGTSGTTSMIGKSTSVNGNQSGGTESTCPSGKLVTGGGFALGDNLAVYNTSMKVTDATKWNAFANNTSSGSALMIVDAICLTP